MRSPLERWRKKFSINGGFSGSESKEKALWASNQIRSDLIEYGLLISETKCNWEPGDCCSGLDLCLTQSGLG